MNDYIGIIDGKDDVISLKFPKDYNVGRLINRIETLEKEIEKLKTRIEILSDDLNIALYSDKLY
jgi:archaellum component FlaC